MSFEMIIGIVLAILLSGFFLFGFFVGATKGRNPNAPLFKKSTNQTENQKRLQAIAENVANYQGNKEGQKVIK